MARSPIYRALGAGVLLFSSCAMAGCSLSRAAGLTVAPVDPTSPVAQDVIAASRSPGPMPKFSGIPSIPTNVRPLSAWQADISDMQSRRAKLETQVAALPPVEAQPTEAFAAEARSRVAGAPGQIAPPDARQRTEAEAQALRERATPPPPPK